VLRHQRHAAGLRLELGDDDRDRIDAGARDAHDDEERNGAGQRRLPDDPNVRRRVSGLRSGGDAVDLL
jgi:hypothetical protein